MFEPKRFLGTVSRERYVKIGFVTRKLGNRKNFCRVVSKNWDLVIITCCTVIPVVETKNYKHMSMHYSNCTEQKKARHYVKAIKNSNTQPG